MSGNDTPNTPDLSETELRATKVDDLRERAKSEGVTGTASMRKEELVEAISEKHRAGGGPAGGTTGNDTPNTPDISETELRATKVDDLRKQARSEGIPGTSAMRKEEIVGAISEAHRNGGPTGDLAGAPGDAGPDGGRLRTGEQTSKSLKYSQEVTSPDDEPERSGRSLATTSREVIRQWAEERGGKPATVEGTEHGKLLGVLRFDFGGDNERLREVSWEEWFKTFDSRKLNFIYQEERTDGRQSTFFRLESPDREDA